ncbi:MAG TPA: ATP-binding protein [Holophagaceae bacterium]|nr:ATP-binding protein [Holophagaceae bacterium]
MTELHRADELRQRLQTELHQTQKLESLGSLAGGVAHDMNNVLGAIQAVTQTLKALHEADPQLTSALDTIERASTRGRDLVQSLTNFARKDLRGAERLDLNALVREESELLKRTTLKRVTLDLDLQEPLPAVMGERSTLGSALMNLCVNAVDAMPGGGTLTLRTRSLPQGQVELSVRDTGLGMPREVLARAMEPFFTTKPVGKGTGLGLALVYATASAHGGSLILQSEPGQGTLAQLRLPATHEDPKAKVAPDSAGGPGDALNVLLVDDEELIRTSVPGLLEVLGHRVITAGGGAEALDLLAGGLQPDLVILDQNMPGMTGMETLKRLRVQHPKLPVLLATGFLETEAAELLRQDGHAACLAKPFGLSDLRTQLQAIFQRIRA